MSVKQRKNNHSNDIRNDDCDYMRIVNDDHQSGQENVILSILTQLRATEKVKKLILPKTDIIIEKDSETMPFPYIYSPQKTNEDHIETNTNRVLRYSTMNDLRIDNNSLMFTNTKQSNLFNSTNDYNDDGIVKKSITEKSGQKHARQDTIESINKSKKNKEDDIEGDILNIELKKKRELEWHNALNVEIEHEKELQKQKKIELQQQQQGKSEEQMDKEPMTEQRIYSRDDNNNEEVIQKVKELNKLKEISKEKEIELANQRALTIQKKSELEKYLQLAVQNQFNLDKLKDSIQHKESTVDGKLRNEEEIKQAEAERLKEIDKQKELDRLVNEEKKISNERQKEIDKLKDSIDKEEEMKRLKENAKEKEIKYQKEIDALNEANKFQDQEDYIRYECIDEDNNQNERQEILAPEGDNDMNIHLDDNDINEDRELYVKAHPQQIHKPPMISITHKDNIKDNNNSMHTQDIDISSKVSSDNETKPPKKKSSNPNPNIKDQLYYPLYATVPNIQTQIDVILNTISTTKLNCDDLSVPSPLLNNFPSTDPTLLTQNQPDILKTEGTSIFSKRRKGFLLNQHLETSFKFNTLYLTQLQNCSESYITRMFNESQHNPNLHHGPIIHHLPSNRHILNLLNQIEEDNSHKTPIDPLNDIISFFYKYPSAQAKPFMEKYAELYDNWRHIHNDGNSFHRGFMFALIEDYILNSRINELVYLINELGTRAHKVPLKELFANGTKEIKLSTTIMLLKGIIVQLLEKKNDVAYQLFLAGYHLDNNAFDSTLIGFLRGIIHDYMKEIYNLLENEGKAKGKTINANAQESIEMIIHEGIEADFFHSCIVAYVFNVNIELLWIEGDGTDPNYDIVKIEDQDKAYLPTISLGYVYTHYIKLYPKNMKKHEWIIYSNMTQKEQGIHQMTYTPTDDNDKVQCAQCKLKSPLVAFLTKGFSICYECLRNYIDTVMTSRASSFISSHFLSLEYHTRDIPLMEEYELNEQEYVEIFKGRGMVDDLKEKINRMCFYCLKVFEIKMLYALKCDCQYCQGCIEKKIANASNADKTSQQKVFCECNHEGFNNSKVLALYQVRKEDDPVTKRSIQKEEC